MRKVQWSTLKAKQEKLEKQVGSLSSKRDELEALNAQIAALITPEAIEETKAKVVKLRSDLERAESTLAGMLAEAGEVTEAGDESNEGIEAELVEVEASLSQVED